MEPETDYARFIVTHETRNRDDAQAGHKSRMFVIYPGTCSARH